MSTVSIQFHRFTGGPSAWYFEHDTPISRCLSASYPALFYVGNEVGVNKYREVLVEQALQGKRFVMQEEEIDLRISRSLESLFQ